MDRAPIISCYETGYTGDNNNQLAIARAVHSEAEIIQVKRCNYQAWKFGEDFLLTNKPKPDLFLVPHFRVGEIGTKNLNQYREMGIFVVGIFPPDQLPEKIEEEPLDMEIYFQSSYHNGFDKYPERFTFYDYCPSPITTDSLQHAHENLPLEVQKIQTAAKGPITVISIGGITAQEPVMTDGSLSIAQQETIRYNLNAMLSVTMEKIAAESGSTLLTTSRRTGAFCMDIIQEHAGRVPSYVHDYAAEGPNPYVAILSVADRVVVSGDSISMIADAMTLGKPVYVFTPDYTPEEWENNCSCGEMPMPLLLPGIKSYTNMLFERGHIHPFEDISKPGIQNPKPLNPASQIGKNVFHAWKAWLQQR